MQNIVICVKNNKIEFSKSYMLYSALTFEIISRISHQNIVYSISSFLKNGTIIYLNRNIKSNSGMLITIKDK